jgi:SAM-dependent methyltransferase
MPLEKRLAAAEAKLEQRKERLEALAIQLAAEREKVRAANEEMKAQRGRIHELILEGRELRRRLDEAEREGRHYEAAIDRLRPLGTVLPDLPPEHLRLHVGTVTTRANFLAQGAYSSERVCREFSPKAGPALDWGCGSGRTLNWLLADPAWGEVYHGCDVDAEAIEWLHRFNFRVELCADTPPLPYPDNYFASIFSFSVLTHIPPTQHRAWYEEFRRVLKPGGRVLCTTTGEVALVGGDIRLADLRAEIAKNGHAFSDIEGHYKHIAIVTQAFSRRAYAGLLLEESYNDPRYNNMDAFVLRKAG